MPVPQTKKAAAITGANTLISIMSQFQSLRQQCADVVKAYNSEAWNSAWSAMATAAQNADGSLGAADGSPNTSHPIDTRVTDQTTLNRAATANQFIATVTFLNDFANFLGNQGVATSQRSQTIDDLVS
jgi:hypothetical protein